MGGLMAAGKWVCPQHQPSHGDPGCWDAPMAGDGEGSASPSHHPYANRTRLGAGTQCVLNGPWGSVPTPSVTPWCRWHSRQSPTC